LEVDLKQDRFRIRYDPRRIAPQRMLETVRKQGFRGEAVKDSSPNASTPGKVRRDMAQLPEDLRKEVQKAKINGKPLLMAFHGPG
jgi:hypothetical protein